MRLFPRKSITFIEYCENARHFFLRYGNSVSCLPPNVTVKSLLTFVRESAIDASTQSLAAIPGFQTAFADNKTGEVLLMVDAKSPDVASAEAAKFLKVPYRIELVPGGFVDVALRGGQDALVQGQRRCMTAFAAKHNTTGKTGLVTAGHCASTNTISLNDGGTNYAMTQGTALNLQPSGDLMFLSGTPPAVAEFYYDGTGAARSVTGTRSRASTTASNGTWSTAGTTTGSFVCHLGQQTLGNVNVVQSCGEVISTKGQVTECVWVCGVEARSV